MEPINQPPQWAPPAPPAPKKERQWLIPTIGLAAVLVLAASVGITVAATGDSATATAATVPGGCSGVAPGKKFECDNGKWVYATPATAPRTTTTEAPSSGEFSNSDVAWVIKYRYELQDMTEQLAKPVPDTLSALIPYCEDNAAAVRPLQYADISTDRNTPTLWTELVDELVTGFEACTDMDITEATPHMERAAALEKQLARMVHQAADSQ